MEVGVQEGPRDQPQFPSTGGTCSQQKRSSAFRVSGLILMVMRSFERPCTGSAPYSMIRHVLIDRQYIRRSELAHSSICMPCPGTANVPVLHLASGRAIDLRSKLESAQWGEPA